MKTRAVPGDKRAREETDRPAAKRPKRTAKDFETTKADEIAKRKAELARLDAVLARAVDGALSYQCPPSKEMKRTADESRKSCSCTHHTPPLCIAASHSYAHGDRRSQADESAVLAACALLKKAGGPRSAR